MSNGNLKMKQEKMNARRQPQPNFLGQMPTNKFMGQLPTPNPLLPMMMPKFGNYDAMNAALMAYQNPFFSMLGNNPVDPFGLQHFLKLTQQAQQNQQAQQESRHGQSPMHERDEVEHKPQVQR